jgi:predicted ATPase/tetratricopeptide (TPR) repeat protein
MGNGAVNAAGLELRLFGAPALKTSRGEVLLAPRRPHQLLAFLACRRHWVARAELAELFWPDRPEGAARTNLRVLLQRVQGEHAGLELQAERVRWAVASDLARFEDAAAAARDDAAIELYRPPLLEGFEAGLPEPLLDWLERERERLDGLWRALVQRRLTALPGTAVAALAARLEQAQPGAVEAERMLATAAARADPEAFIGRRAERAEIVARLRGGTRVVVITGCGGIGKTALLRAVLPELARELDMKALPVPLADLTELQQVPSRVALALGATLRPGGDAWEQLATALSANAKPSLLGLDNAEHLAGLDARLAVLLAACPGLRLVLSSRRRLDLDAAVLPLEGLPQPDDDDDHELDTLRRFDAVRLFEARARAVSPGFELARQREALLNVLRATEGLPLALELAAAATRFMPLADIASELVRSLEVLDASAAGSARGERSLRACFERSWALLDPPARDGLARLAWLPGPFARAMAAQVAGVSLVGLAGLVDRSLLRGDRQGRMSLHPLLRQFVAERQPVVDAAALAARHAAYVDHLLAAVDSVDLRSSPATLRMLDNELPHLRAAWAFVVASKRPQAAAAASRLARLMGAYYVARGGAQEILPLLQHAVDSMALEGRSGLAARAITLRTLAMLEYHRGALASAQSHARQALRWASQAGDAGTAIACLTVLGNALQFAGQFEAARPHFEQAYRRSLERGDLSIASAAANGLGLTERARGRYAQAIERFQEAGRLSAEVGDVGGQVTMLINIGNVQGLEQRWDEARCTNEQALALVESFGLDSKRAILHTILGEIDLEDGQLAHARRHLEQAVAALDQGGDSVVPTQVHLTRAALEVAEGHFNAAALALAEGVAAAHASGSSTMQLSALNAAGALLAALGAPDEATRLWSEVLGHPAASVSIRARADRGLAKIGRAPLPLAAPSELPALIAAVLDRLSGPLGAPAIRS